MRSVQQVRPIVVRLISFKCNSLSPLAGGALVLLGCNSALVTLSAIPLFSYRIKLTENEASRRVLVSG
jgi:hypothetical protein